MAATDLNPEDLDEGESTRELVNALRADHGRLDRRVTTLYRDIDTMKSELSRQGGACEAHMMNMKEQNDRILRGQEKMSRHVTEALTKQTGRLDAQATSVKKMEQRLAVSAAASTIAGAFFKSKPRAVAFLILLGSMLSVVFPENRVGIAGIIKRVTGVEIMAPKPQANGEGGASIGKEVGGDRAVGLGYFDPERSQPPEDQVEPLALVGKKAR